MKEEIKKGILSVLSKAIKILEVKEEKDFEELKKLSDQAIEDVALHKDLDIISITVLLYSIYKIIGTLDERDYQYFLRSLNSAKNFLEQGNLGGYNRIIKTLFKQVKQADAPVKEHLQDVMQAARIKKGTVLLQHGLSLGQAAGLMGLSNWDLQQYAGTTTTLEQHHEIIPAQKRLLTALKIFNIS